MKYLTKSTLTVAMLAASSFCLGQVKEQSQVTLTVDRFLKYVSFADTLSIKFDSLYLVFTPDAKLTANFGKEPASYTLRQFIENIHRNIKAGRMHRAQETELSRKVDIFGKIAHVWSTYEFTFTGKDGKSTSRRGINSIQLLKHEEKWLIYSIAWDRESEELKLPATYLSNK